MRLPTRQGFLYFKALLNERALELPLTQDLSRRHPGLVPNLLAVEPRQHWIVMEEFGGPLLRDVPTEANWEAALRAYARLQIDSLAGVDRLLALGCADRRPEAMASSLDALIEAVPRRLDDPRTRLTDAELSRLRARAPRLKVMCAALEECGVPVALEHGDLHAGNIAVTRRGPLLFDWSASCVTHPFFCLGDLLEDNDELPSAPETIDRLRECYLEAWTRYAPMDRLLTTYRRCRSLRPLLHALGSERTVALYQGMLDRPNHCRITATGWSLGQAQWWLADHLRKLQEPEMFAQEGVEK
jgi:aminoglycoside phosphotransferase (APT) family kinase protein